MNKKVVIIANKSYFKGIVKYIRKTHPLLDFKIYSREDLLNFYLTKYDGNIINFVMNKHSYHYDFIKEILQYVPYVKEDSKVKRIHNIFELKKEIDENFISKRYPYLKERLGGSDIIVYGYSKEDFMINRILKELNLDFSFYHEEASLSSELLSFSSYNDEIIYTLNEIARLIDEENIKPSDIYLYCTDENYLNYIKQISGSYHLLVNNLPAKKLIGLNVFKTMMNDFEESKDILEVIKNLEAIEEKDEATLNLIEALKLLDLKDLDYIHQKEVIEESLKNVTFENEIYKNAINIISSPIFDIGKHIFILNFSRGVIPLSPSTSAYLNDEEKRLINFKDSIMETVEYKDEMLEFLNSKNHFHFSYSSKINSKDNDPSILKEELHLQIKKAKIPLKMYSFKTSNYIYTSLLDQKRKYDVISPYLESYKDLDIPYYTYNNQFDGLKSIEFKKALSYSSTKLYLGCPFSYYCSKILKLEPFEENYGARLGTFFHAVLEDSVALGDKFNFDQSYEKHFEEGKFDKKETFITDRYKQNLIEAVNNTLKHLRDIPLNEVRTEYKKYVKLDDGTLIDGTIDKIIISNNYIYLIDYKTGKGETFNPDLLDYGLSLQLPTYALIASIDKDLKDIPLGGVYINTVIDSEKLYIGQEERDLKYLRLAGKTLADDEAVKGIDPEYKEYGAKYIAAKGFSLDKGYPKERFIGRDVFDSYIEKAEKFYKEAKKGIINKEFDIKPMFINGYKACEFCKFKDVCFLKEDQKRIILIDKKGDSDDALE